MYFISNHFNLTVVVRENNIVYARQSNTSNVSLSELLVDELFTR